MSAKEIQAWQKVRERGMWRYVLTSHAVATMVGCVMGLALWRWHQGLPFDDFGILLIWCAGVIGGVLMGIRVWHNNESRFRRAIAQGEKK